MTNVAVLGTGIMGTGVAHSLRRCGFEVSAWNRTPSKASAVGEGVTVATSPPDAVDGASFVITMLPDSDVVREVIEPCLASMSNALWLQMSTVGIAGSEDLSALAGKFDVGFLDCPVLGTKQPAEDGTLTVLVSGSSSLATRAQPVFDAIGSTTHHLGEDASSSSASAMKLVVNSWLVEMNAALAETIVFAESIDSSASKFLEIIDGGPLNSPYAQMKGAMMVKGDYPTSFPLSMAAKDACLIAEAARDAGVELPINAETAALYQRAERSHGDADMAAVKTAF